MLRICKCKESSSSGKCKLFRNTTFIEGIVKILSTFVGILGELYGHSAAPMGKITDENQQFTHPENWQHATMYFFFGISGIADVISVVAKAIVPDGINRIFLGLAFYIEGYLFFFHLHGRSDIDYKVHILVVITVWTCALTCFLQCCLIAQEQLLHVFEVIESCLVISQGTWFWQVAYILYPPSGDSWDPCIHVSGHDGHLNEGQHRMQATTCNSEGAVNSEFITIVYTWHLITAMCVVFFIESVVYCCEKTRMRTQHAPNLLSAKFTNCHYSAVPR